jgi:hypothetical protein
MNLLKINITFFDPAILKIHVSHINFYQNTESVFSCKRETSTSLPFTVTQFSAISGLPFLSGFNRLLDIVPTIRIDDRM